MAKEKNRSGLSLCAKGIVLSFALVAALATAPFAARASSHNFLGEYAEFFHEKGMKVVLIDNQALFSSAHPQEALREKLAESNLQLLPQEGEYLIKARGGSASRIDRGEEAYVVIAGADVDVCFSNFQAKLCSRFVWEHEIGHIMSWMKGHKDESNIFKKIFVGNDYLKQNKLWNTYKGEIYADSYASIKVWQAGRKEDLLDVVRVRYALLFGAPESRDATHVTGPAIEKLILLLEQAEVLNGKAPEEWGKVEKSLAELFPSKEGGDKAAASILKTFQEGGVSSLSQEQVCLLAKKKKKKWSWSEGEFFAVRSLMHSLRSDPIDEKTSPEEIIKKAEKQYGKDMKERGAFSASSGRDALEAGFSGKQRAAIEEVLKKAAYLLGHSFPGSKKRLSPEQEARAQSTSEQRGLQPKI